jgi:putative endonuclease
MTWYTYIVRCADQTLYTGITKDVEERIAAHNQGSGAKYTRSRRPVVLLYTETFSTRSAAASREYHVKKLNQAAKLALIGEACGDPP